MGLELVVEEEEANTKHGRAMMVHSHAGAGEAGAVVITISDPLCDPL